MQRSSQTIGAVVASITRSSSDHALPVGRRSALGNLPRVFTGRITSAFKSDTARALTGYNLARKKVLGFVGSRSLRAVRLNAILLCGPETISRIPSRRASPSNGVLRNS